LKETKANGGRLDANFYVNTSRRLDAIKHLRAELARSVADGGFLPVEGDDALNDASRAVVDSYEVGCWLGRINEYQTDPKFGTRENVAWKWAGDTVRNFSATWVIHGDRDITALVDLIRERTRAPYTGTGADRKRVDEIFAEVGRLGGATLEWS
jgi:hypothetical protein